MKNYFIVHLLFWQLATIFLVIDAKYLSSYKNTTQGNSLEPGNTPKIFIRILKMNSTRKIFGFFFFALKMELKNLC